jgi:hypothetical protein
MSYTYKRKKKKEIPWWEIKERKRKQKQCSEDKAVYTAKVKLPGNKKTRRRAISVLKAQKLDRNVWRVWGGKNDHIVTYGNGSIKCDCWVNKDGGVCSHIIKVLYETKVMPKG